MSCKLAFFHHCLTRGIHLDKPPLEILKYFGNEDKYKFDTFSVILVGLQNVGTEVSTDNSWHTVNDLFLYSKKNKPNLTR